MNYGLIDCHWDSWQRFLGQFASVRQPSPWRASCARRDRLPLVPRSPSPPPQQPRLRIASQRRGGGCLEYGVEELVRLGVQVQSPRQSDPRTGIRRRQAALN